MASLDEKDLIPYSTNFLQRMIFAVLQTELTKTAKIVLVKLAGAHAPTRVIPKPYHAFIVRRSTNTLLWCFCMSLALFDVPGTMTLDLYRPWTVYVRTYVRMYVW